MNYKNIKEFVGMLMNLKYQAALAHREARLEATEVFVSRPLIKKPIR